MSYERSPAPAASRYSATGPGRSGGILHSTRWTWRHATPASPGTEYRRSNTRFTTSATSNTTRYTYPRDCGPPAVRAPI